MAWLLACTVQHRDLVLRDVKNISPDGAAGVGRQALGRQTVLYQTVP